MATQRWRWWRATALLVVLVIGGSVARAIWAEPEDGPGDTGKATFHNLPLVIATASSSIALNVTATDNTTGLLRADVACGHALFPEFAINPNIDQLFPLGVSVGKCLTGVNTGAYDQAEFLVLVTRNNSLITKVNQINAKAGVPNPAACNAVDAFRNEVRAQAEKKALDVPAPDLLALADWAAGRLPCR